MGRSMNIILLMFLSKFDFLLLERNPYETAKFPNCWNEAATAMQKITNREIGEARDAIEWPECGGMPNKKKESNSIKFIHI